jgi:hypothetical protein
MRQDRSVRLAMDHRALNIADRENFAASLLRFAHRGDRIGVSPDCDITMIRSFSVNTGSR